MLGTILLEIFAGLKHCSLLTFMIFANFYFTFITSQNQKDFLSFQCQFCNFIFNCITTYNSLSQSKFDLGYHFKMTFLSLIQKNKTNNLLTLS